MKTITTLFVAIALSFSMLAHAGESNSFAAAHVSQEDMDVDKDQAAKKAAESNDPNAIIIVGKPLEAPNSIQQQPQKWMVIGSDLRHLLGDGPRQHIINEQSYVSTKISAECQAKFDRNFAILKKSAMEEMQPKARKHLEDVNFEVVEFDLHRVQGLTTYRDETIRYSSDLCNTPEYYMIGVMGHELGHMVSFYGDDEIMGILNHDGRYENIVFVSHVNLMEVAANRWGARIVRDAHIDSAKFLAVLDRVCAKGGREFCTDAADWREGLIE